MYAVRPVVPADHEAPRRNGKVGAMVSEANLMLQVPIRTQCRFGRHSTTAAGALGIHLNEIASVARMRDRVTDADYDPRVRPR
jgi:hypothetical protein